MSERRAERELMFRKAGINVDEGPGQLLYEAYNGRMTTDDIADAAERYGVLTGGDAFAPGERSQSRELSALHSESETPGGAASPDPHALGLAKFQEARAEGKPAADAADEYFGRVMRAAYVDHDPRALFDQDRWAAENAGSSKPY